MMTRGLFFTLVALAPVGPLGAQGNPTQAMETITAADFRRRLYIIADDSMGGRDTPSRGLESTARYIAREFERMGLVPAGGGNGYFQRYGIRLRDIDPAGSSLVLADQMGHRVELRFGKDARLANGAPLDKVTTRDLALGGGAIQPTTELDPAAVAGRALFWAADFKSGQAGLGQILIAGANAGASLIILSVNDDSAFARLPGMTRNIVQAESVGWPPVIVVRESAILAALPETEGAIGGARAGEAHAAAVEGWTATATIAFARDERVEVPNVVGIVPGTDPTLKNEYLAISAHFDHVGSRCRGVSAADSICNGANDNGSGTTGLLELAEAFANPAARPRRSILFVAVSGEERGLWGSEYFARNPTVPIDRIVANINMDHLGRNWRDSIVVIGQEHSDLGTTVNAVAIANRDLGIGVLPDQWPSERIYFRSDHYNFARNGVPILFFTNGFHQDYHAVTDTPDKVDPEVGARTARLIFRTASAISDRTERPKWNPESERLIVRRQKPVP